MQIAIGAIGIGIVLMVGYLVIAQVGQALPDIENFCFQQDNSTGACEGRDNSSQFDTSVSDGITSTQATVFAGFGLIAVGIIVLAAFGLINIFK